jgi:xanthine dehydrogenase accessory factor
MMTERQAWRAEALADERVPYVQATVVRARRPASVRPGATALVLADGHIEGFVGGACAEESVRLHALRVLETGEALVLRIEPAERSGDEREARGSGDADALDGAVTVHNPCVSGGGLEIFLEPHLPPARVHVVGDTPVAFALAELGRDLGYDVAPSAGGDLELGGDDAAVVVASHGRDEERALVTALEAGIPYVGLVASRARGGSVKDALDVRDEDRARVHTPAGLDIGARTPEEIALSILAEIVSTRRVHTMPRVSSPPQEGHHCCDE